MADITNISQFPIKVIFAIHFALVTWATQGWYVPSMILYNVLFFVSLFWAVHSPESDEPVQFALFINVASIFFDIIGIAVNSPFSGFSYARFGASLMIINLLIRGVTSIFLLRIAQSRGGSLATVFPGPTTGTSRRDYEDISHPVPQNSDFA